MARAYRKMPVVVEAVQWTGENHAEMCEFVDPEAFEIIPRIGLVIHTLEGDYHASPGDYIIKGVNGEFYPCKPDIFAKTYESSTLTPPAEDNNVPAKALNEPLTLEELREMDEEPVYVVPKDKPAHCGGWCGVTVWKCDRYSYVSLLRDADSGWGFEKYGKTWIAYRRPPEGGNDVS